MDVNGFTGDFAGGLPAECAVVTESECRDNEFGYMYYYNGITADSPGYFTQLIDSAYWSSTTYTSGAEAYGFDMSDLPSDANNTD